ncbi:MAG TPA: alpha/beta fold hydrolase [Acidimicrobiales bacterium]
MRFVLVHGGFHGAWCWGPTIAELERLGHEAVAVDLPGHGERRDEQPTIASRRDTIVAALRPGDVVVGHSGGGYDATIAVDAATDLVSHVVYLAAGLPREGRTIPEAMTNRNAEDGPIDGDVTGMLGHLRFADDGTMTWGEFATAWEFFYHDCDEATARWAFERLSPERPGDYHTSPISVPRFWAADLPRSYILCLQDRAKPHWLSDVVIERLGVDALTIDTSHSPFLSRPRELAELLVHATTTKPVGPLRPD